jgi:nicotinamidase-related amidase
MSKLDLRVRYFQDSTPLDIPCREENFVRRHLQMPLPLEQTALVLVDIWNVHFIKSWIERASKITREVILPIIGAARQSPLAIIHAPSPPVAEQYDQLGGLVSSSATPKSIWPPTEFRHRSGEYTVFRGPRSQPPGIGAHWNPIADQLSISPLIDVLKEEYVIATGQQLHDLLTQKGILHLIYVGFATNWCVLGRDYGIRAMSGRGYNIILLREATTGVEFPDTVNQLFTTEIAIREVEQQYGFTASKKDFLRACQTLNRDNP